jgi:uncharacterized repeat protein (TIGR03837 family)
MHGPHSHSVELSTKTPLLWDVFCRVIDNFGDIGVCWRLCADLACLGHTVRLWVDDAQALSWMAPGALQGQWAGIRVGTWAQCEDPGFVRELNLADVWVEGFGCELPGAFVTEGVERVSSSEACPAPTWINLEYLSAEPFVQRSHGLASPVMAGAAKGWTKYFYFPGFFEGTGGLLRERDLETRQAQFDAVSWLMAQGVRRADYAHIVSLFCYEPLALCAWLDQWASADKAVCLLVSVGRSSDFVRRVLDIPASENQVRKGNLTLVFLPALSQIDFDHLLWSCDLNCVRGEDSLVRALWAGKPLLWHIYPQSDDAHHAKLNALLDVVGANAALRQLHWAWNEVTSDAPAAPSLPRWSWSDLSHWTTQARVTRARLSHLPALSDALVDFVWKKR